jgi:DNA end-binding protein Ku
MGRFANFGNTFYHGAMAARATGSATISFGLVSIPVKLYTAISPSSVSFHMLHKPCGTRVKMQLYCPFDKEVVQRRDTVKGFEHQKDHFVRFEDEELKKLESEKTDRLEIVEFVPKESVDWVYLADAHYLGPGKGGDRAYKLLAESMERTAKMALGRYYTHGKTRLVVLRAHAGGIVMHEVHYASEVRPMDEVEQPGKIEFKPIEQELADKLVQQLSVPAFNPGQFHDDYRDRVLAAVEQKVAGQEVTAAPAEPQAQVIDLFEALKRSLAEKTAPAPANEAAPAEGERAPKAAEEAGEDRGEEGPPALAKARERRAPRRKQASS